VSLAHSNSSHSLYLALNYAGLPGVGPGQDQGVHGVMIEEDSLNSNLVKSTEHTRDWILLPVTFKQLRKVFRLALIHLSNVIKAQTFSVLQIKQGL